MMRENWPIAEIYAIIEGLAEKDALSQGVRITHLPLSILRMP